jgi:hypothetical protein
MRLIRIVDVDQRVAVSPTGYSPEPGTVGAIRTFVFGIEALTWSLSAHFDGFSRLTQYYQPGERAVDAWIVGIFIFGLSHGGLDDEVSSMAGRTGARAGSPWRFYAWYLGLLALVVECDQPGSSANDLSHLFSLSLWPGRSSSDGLSRRRRA